MRRTKNYKNCSDEELLGYLVDFGRKLAINDYRMWHEKSYVIPKDIEPMEPLFSQMMSAKDFPHPKIYINRFGTWHNALRLAGFEEHNEDPYKMTTDDLADWVAENSSFSREFAAKMLDGVDQRKWSPRKKRERKETDSNSYEISLPAYHFA